MRFSEKKTALISFGNFDRQCLLRLREYLDIDVYSKPGRPTGSELVRFCYQYDVMIVGVAETFAQSMYRDDFRVRMIATSSVGTDHIDDAFKKATNIQIISLNSSNAVSVAEHTLLLILMVIKQIYSNNMLNSQPRELFGKTVGVLGAGHIGSKVIRLVHSLGANIVCHTRNPERHQDLIDKMPVRFVSLEQLARTSDILSLHYPLDSNTRNIISRDVINEFKEGMYLVNAARGGLVDHVALANAMREGIVAGVAFDDIDDNDRSYYAGLKNMIVTPHIAGNTIEANRRMDIDLTDKIIRLLPSL